MRPRPAGSRSSPRLGLLVGLLLAAAVPGARTARGGEDAASGEAADLQRDLAVAQAARPGVVRVQWRAPGTSPEVHERNAVVVDAQGLLLLAGAPPPSTGTLTATFSDGGARRASVVASDPESALSLLWVPLGGLTPLPLAPAPRPAPTGTAAAAEGTPPAVGDPLPPGTRVVMVTGTGAVARGWIRAGDRRRVVALEDRAGTVDVGGLVEAALPTVAEDLGSPWLDAEGRVVALLLGAEASALPAPTGGGPVRVEPTAAHGVTAHTAGIVWPLLRTQRAVPRARLGVAAGPVSEALEMHVCKGCGGGQLIWDVEPGGPADLATIQRHDILTAVDGVPLRRGMSLADALLPHRPGTHVEIDVMRRGESLRVQAVLGSRDD